MRTKQNTPVEHYGDMQVGYAVFRLPLAKAQAMQALLADAVEVKKIYSGGGGVYLRRTEAVGVAISDPYETTFDATMLSRIEADRWETEILNSLGNNAEAKLVDALPPEQWSKLKGETK